MMNAGAIEIDGVAYARIAECFARGAFGEALASVFPPFYPLGIAVFHLVIPDVETAGRLVSLACALLLIYGSYVAAKRLLGTEKALWVSLFIAIHPYLTRYSAQVLSESLATLLFGATVFLFYIGYTGKRARHIALAGFLLVLTYLTRPEYIVYYAPFILFLLYRRRFAHTALLFIPFLVLGLGYILFMRVETGFWVVSGKAIHSPFVSLSATLINIPVVAFHFLAALFLPFVLLLMPGVSRVERSYRNLLLALTIFHVVSLACVGHSTRRYSVEFVPLVMPMVVEGWYVLKGYLQRFKHVSLLWCLATTVLLVVSLSQGIERPHKGRELFKQAGHYLLRHDRGAVIASRLPLPSFYAEGSWLQVSPSCLGAVECKGFFRALENKSARYVILDDGMERECPWLNGCLHQLPLTAEFSNREGFVKIYRVLFPAQR